MWQNLQLLWSFKNKIVQLMIYLKNYLQKESLQDLLNLNFYLIISTLNNKATYIDDQPTIL